MKVINNYLSDKFPSEYTSKKEVILSKEAVFYFNSISDIIRVINKTGLTPEQTNIICADTYDNKLKLKRIGHSIGKISLKGEPNKMFTFCTKTAYIGSDFYSDCASTFVFADPNIKSLALDISLDLPQIAGRQRNKENPFKNNVVVFYKTLRKDNVMSREEFDILQDSRRGATQKLLDIYNKVTQVEKKEYLRKIRDGIVVSGYSDDFVSISRKTGKPVYNTLIDLANERAWEVSQKDYQDKISVTKSLDSISRSLEIKSKLEQDIQDFLDFHFYKTELFNEKMKMYCEFMDLHKGEEGLEQILQAKIGNPDFKKYYNFYGTKGCSAKLYVKSYLEQGMLGTLKKDEFTEQVYLRFRNGDRLTKKEVKQKLQEIYTALGLTGKPRASDLGKYFSLTRSIITDPQTKKKYEGYRLGKL